MYYVQGENKEDPVRMESFLLCYLPEMTFDKKSLILIKFIAEE